MKNITIYLFISSSYYSRSRLVLAARDHRVSHASTSWARALNYSSETNVMKSEATPKQSGHPRARITVEEYKKITHRTESCYTLLDSSLKSRGGYNFAFLDWVRRLGVK